MNQRQKWDEIILIGTETGSHISADSLLFKENHSDEGEPRGKNKNVLTV